MAKKNSHKKSLRKNSHKKSLRKRSLKKSFNVGDSTGVNDSTDVDKVVNYNPSGNKEIIKTTSEDRRVRYSNLKEKLGNFVTKTSDCINNKINKPNLAKKVETITPYLAIAATIISPPLGAIVTNASRIIVNKLTADNTDNTDINKYIEIVDTSNKINILNGIINNYLKKLKVLETTRKLKVCQIDMFDQYEEYIGHIFLDLKKNKKDTLGAMHNLILEFKEWITMFFGHIQNNYFYLMSEIRVINGLNIEKRSDSLTELRTTIECEELPLPENIINESYEIINDSCVI
jgi:hypothetical protein